MRHYFLCESEDDAELARLGTTRQGVLVSLKTRNGVRAVTDMAYLDAEDLTRMLFDQPPRVPKPRRRRGRAA